MLSFSRDEGCSVRDARDLSAGKPQIIVLISLLIACSSLPIRADESEGRIRGYGNKSCEEYVAARSQKDGDAAYAAWLEGYLTALGMSGDVPQSVLDKIDLLKAAPFLENYCRSGPRQNFWDATDALITFHLRSPAEARAENSSKEPTTRAASADAAGAPGALVAQPSQQHGQQTLESGQPSASYQIHGQPPVRVQLPPQASQQDARQRQSGALPLPTPPQPPKLVSAQDVWQALKQAYPTMSENDPRFAIIYNKMEAEAKAGNDQAREDYELQRSYYDDQMKYHDLMQQQDGPSSLPPPPQPPALASPQDVANSINRQYPTLQPERAAVAFAQAWADARAMNKHAVEEYELSRKYFDDQLKYAEKRPSN
jgi:hypothetical protein